MTQQGYGILAVCMLVAVICIGVYGIIGFSLTAAAAYLAGCIVLMVLLVYVFCAKCPIRLSCHHVLMGLMTRIMPRRKEAPYTPCEIVGTFVFFVFIALFPQYWLVRDPALLLLFWVLFTGQWILTHFTLCRGCGNTFCILRSDER